MGLKTAHNLLTRKTILYRPTMRSTWFGEGLSVKRLKSVPSPRLRDVYLYKNAGYTGNDADAVYLSTSSLRGGSDNPRKVLSPFVMAALYSINAFIKAQVRWSGKAAPLHAEYSHHPIHLCHNQKNAPLTSTCAGDPTLRMNLDLGFEEYHICKRTNLPISTMAVI